MYRFDGSTVLVIKTGVTYTVTHQTTLSSLNPPGRKTLSTRAIRRRPHSKPLVGQASSDARCRRAHGARLGRWRSQKHRWWPSAGVSGGGRDLTLRADDPTSRGTTQPPTNPTQQTPNNPTESTILLLGPPALLILGPGQTTAIRVGARSFSTLSHGRSAGGFGGEAASFGAREASA